MGRLAAALGIEEVEAHHKYGPSTLPKLAKCVCFENTPVPSMADEPMHPANVGTRVHALAKGYLDDATPELEAMDSAESEMGQEAADWIKSNYYGHKIHSEIRLDIDIDGLTTFGTGDIIAEPKDKLILKCLDIKTSQERGDFMEQVAAYAFAAMAKFGYEQTEVTLLYTRLGYRPEDTFYITIEEAREVVKSVLEKCYSKDKQPTPDEMACKYCAKKLTCPPVLSIVKQVATGYNPEAVAALEVALNEYHPSQMDANDLVTAKAIWAIIKKWGESVDYATKQQFELGNVVRGYKQIAIKKVSIDASDLDAVYKRSGLELPDFLTCCDVKASKLRDAMALKAGLPKTGKKPKDHFAAQMGALIQTKTESQIRKGK